MSTPHYQDLSRFRVQPGFRGRKGAWVFLWQIVQSTLFRCSPQFSYGWRRFLLRLFGAKIGRGVLVRPTARITYPWKVEIGDYTWVGDDAELYSLGPISIGENTVVSQRSYLCTCSHDYSDITFSLTPNRIVIEAEDWIAADCFVGTGVRIGRGVIVAARSTVLKNVEPAHIVAGQPAAFKALRAPEKQPS